MDLPAIAEIYVEKAVYHFDKPYSYVVPEELAETLKRGCRVLVPFGGGDRTRQGMVVGIREVGTVDSKVKPVFTQLDDTPIFDEEAFSMALFLVKNTFCTFYDAVKTILPGAYAVRVTDLIACTLDGEQIDEFPYPARMLLRFLQTPQTREDTAAFMKAEHLSPAMLNDLIVQGALERRADARRKRGDDTVRMVRLVADLEGVKLTAKQREVCDFLEAAGTATCEEVLYFCAVGESVLKTLVKKEILAFYRREVVGGAVQSSGTGTAFDLALTSAQQSVFDGIDAKAGCGEANVCLLYGITGSGKTAVFLKLIEAAIARGKQALLLVPEIALTPQITAQFLDFFGDRVAVMHSGLSVGERLDAYKRIKAGKADVVIGTRSAVFAPLQQIGLIILDEEGEPSYKSDAAPRYHAREVAKLRAVTHQATLLLASATPSVESYYKAQSGVYSMFTLEERYAGAVLPEVYLVDMIEEEKNANTSSMSRMLQRELQKNLECGEQSILFMNRRGYRTVACCLSCGEVLQCPHCDVPLTYHKDNGYMMCHHCGHAQKFTRTCPACGSEHFKLSGMGTQRIEDELAERFPDARVLRMDTDTTSSRYAYTEKFEAFRRGEYDILIGTQMIAKGLDFKNVTLVGVLNADSGLYANDYRGVERVFSLITQVVGRSGRAEKTGRAYIQTYVPEHPVIGYAAEQNFPAFYADEIEARRALAYPPFCDICMLHLSAVKESAVEAAASSLVELVKQLAKQEEGALALKLYGPLTPSLNRLNGKYRRQVLLKCRANHVFKEYLRGVLKAAGQGKAFRGVTLYADMNGDCG